MTTSYCTALRRETEISEDRGSFFCHKPTDAGEDPRIPNPCSRCSPIQEVYVTGDGNESTHHPVYMPIRLQQNLSRIP